LPDTVVSAEYVNSFKSRLDKFWSVHDFVYDYIEMIHLLPEVTCNSIAGKRGHWPASEDILLAYLPLTLYW